MMIKPFSSIIDSRRVGSIFVGWVRSGPEIWTRVQLWSIMSVHAEASWVSMFGLLQGNQSLISCCFILKVCYITAVSTDLFNISYFRKNGKYGDWQFYGISFTLEGGSRQKCWGKFNGNGRNAFWRILKATERSFLYLYADALSSSNSVSCHIWGIKAEVWGDCPPLCPNVEPRLFYTIS